MIEQGLEQLCREACNCRICFQGSGLRAPLIDIAQPRWVGPRYRAAIRRIVIMMLNPGGGESRADGADAEFRRLLKDFRDGSGPLDAVFRHQALDLPTWGRGRFASFYLRGLGLHLDAVAFANIAWCATSGNKYPGTMLNACFDRHTGRLLSQLDPHVVLLSGSTIHRYAQRIQAIVPAAKIIPMMHYAHREGSLAERAELERVGEMMK
jgi:hypothetical protein